MPRTIPLNSVPVRVNGNWHCRAVGHHLLGRTLDHQEPLCAVIHQGRRRTPGMVERQRRNPVHRRGHHAPRVRTFPQRAVHRVGADASQARIGVGSQQPRR